MELPKEVLKKIAELEKKRIAQKEREGQAEKDRQQKAEELRQLKESRRIELLICAEKINTWIVDFLRSKDSEKLFRVVRESSIVAIHHDNFWQGYPTEKHSYCYASLWISKDGQVKYVERYKGHQAHETPIGQFTFTRQTIVPELFEKLHPDFLKNAAESLESGKVWEWITQQISSF